MTISKDLLPYVNDGDLHAKLEGVEYSTNLREIVTVGYMLDHQLLSDYLKKSEV